MNRTLLLILVWLALGLTNPIVAQTGRPDLKSELNQLLTKPVLVPEDQTTSDETDKPKRLPAFFDVKRPPADDAPLADLLDYWTAMGNNTLAPPSDQVSQRLFEACMADPERLSALVDRMPRDSNAASRIKELYDSAQGDQKFDDHWRGKVKQWLLFNSNHFVSELLTEAQKVKDNKNGYVDNADALVALARVDWESAEPLVRSLVNSGQPRASTLALTILYTRAIAAKDSAAEERYRSSLKALASDRDQPASVRDKSIDTLSLTNWSGRDEWYLSLFKDETLINLIEGHSAFSPLTTLFAQDPEKWIPIIARFTESKDLTLRSTAARCLIIFQNDRARKDALAPLLPWLSNPDWATDRFQSRLRLIQSMQNLDLPESVPGLIWAVENDEDSANRTYAAQSLSRYADPRAIPALKKALSRENKEDDIARIIQGLLASMGLTEQEQLDGIEAYALKTLTPEGLAEVTAYRGWNEPPLSVPLNIGKYLVIRGPTNHALVRAVLQRAESLKKSNQPLAQALLKLTHNWRTPQIDLDLIQRIGNGSANTEAIMQALERRSHLRESLELELRGLLAAGGPAQGIAAVLLADGSFAQNILSSDDQWSQVALLASSRLTNTRLPVQLVSPLLRSKNDLLTFAAERYLLFEDSKEAREALWQHYPNKAFVTGWRETIQYLEESYAVMDQLEKELRAELFKDDGPTEIYALLSNNEAYKTILRVYNDRVVYTQHEDPSRYLERIVSKPELASFRDFIAQNGVEDSGPIFDRCHHDCASSEYLRLTKDKGRRVFTRSGFASNWGLIRERFEQLSHGDNVKIRYSLEKELKGLEILFAGNNLKVQDVWTQGSEVRIFLEREETEAEQNEQHKLYQQDEENEETEFTLLERQQRMAANNRARFTWRILANGKADRLTTQPQGYLTFDETRSLLPESLATSSSYSNPIVTPDGTWVVAAKADQDWSAPNYVVRYNLRTGREFRVRLEPASEFNPVAFVPVHGKFLLRRAKETYDPANTSVGPDRPEYYLLDAATGATQLVTGVFAPLREQGNRSLQPTGNPNEFWAAISDEEKNQTQVGRYNLKDFTFKSTLTVPHISFRSLTTWVDAKNEKIYVVYKDQLLRLPFKQD